jgi:hypothetical protein
MSQTVVVIQNEVFGVCGKDNEKGRRAKKRNRDEGG